MVKKKTETFKCSLLWICCCFRLQSHQNFYCTNTKLYNLFLSPIEWLQWYLDFLLLVSEYVYKQHFLYFCLSYTRYTVHILSVCKRLTLSGTFDLYQIPCSYLLICVFLWASNLRWRQHGPYCDLDPDDPTVACGVSQIHLAWGVFFFILFRVLPASCKFSNSTLEILLCVCVFSFFPCIPNSAYSSACLKEGYFSNNSAFSIRVSLKKL